MEPQPRRMVRVRKRKVLHDSSNPGLEASSQKPKRVKQESEPESATASNKSPEVVRLDWGLKIKARFLSSSTLEWAKPTRAKQESQGLASFLQPTSHQELEPVCEVQSSLHYWEHPSLPTLSIFTDHKHRATPQLLKGAEFTDSLKHEWSVSFRSLFQLFRLGACQHFYLSCQMLTILFHNELTPQAVVTPTTSGLRRALTREGVEYTMPLAPQDEAPPSDEESSDWLDSVIAREENIVKKIKPVQCVDSRPESAILVPAGSLQSLFNYLLNCKSLVSTSGAMAGIPPTLIAPQAFQGATLKALKVNVGSMTEQLSDGSRGKRHYLDVSGPILPHTLKHIRTLLSSKHSDIIQHTVSFADTAVFNKLVS